MSERRRNLAVGLTVLLALALLGAMILMFAGLPVGLRGLFDDGYRVRIQTPNSAGVKSGDTVHLAGLRVGRITDVRYTDPADPARGVTLEAWIDRNVRIPSAAVCHLSQQVMGGVHIELRVDPRARREGQFVDTDGKAILPGVPHTADLGEQLGPALKKVEQVTGNFNKLLAILVEDAPTQTDAGAPPPGAGLRGTLQRLHRTLDAVYATLDAENRQNLRETLANLRTASQKAVAALDALQGAVADARGVAGKAGQAAEKVTALAETAQQRVDALGKKLIHDADRLSELLTTATDVVRRLREGDGTAGKLLNDPKLYNALLETTEQLRHVLQDVRSVLAEWKEKGLKLDL